MKSSPPDEFEIDILRQPPPSPRHFAPESGQSSPRELARPIRPIATVQPDSASTATGITSSPWGSSTNTLTGNSIHQYHQPVQPYNFDPRAESPSPGFVYGGGDSGRTTPLGNRNSSMNQSQHSFSASHTNLLSRPASPVLAQAPVKGDSGIARLHERDDSDFWKGWRRKVYYAIPVLTILNAILYVVYLTLRITCVVYAQNAANEVYIQAWVFIAIEFCVAIPPLMHNMWTMMAIKNRGRPKLRLVGQEVPTVDVFITCCGEDDDVVMDTVIAACNQDYPKDRFRVLLLDDGKSASLEKAMGAIAHTYPNTFYVARPKFPGVPHHFKAGNLNYALDHVHTLPGGAGFYMAALDADMIPESCWLRALLPHLLRDEKVAMACPPQLFYNTPRGDPLAQSLDFFVHVIEPIKDAMGVAWCTGSGYVVRRDALDEIGNFPLGSLAEDVATSTHLLGRGWKTAYVHEPLQFGTVPEDFGGHLKQRTRWAIGTVDTSFKLNFSLWGDKVRDMSVAQRFSGFLYATLNLYTIMLSVSLFAIPIILAMGKPLVAYSTDNQLRWLIRACFASLMANRLCELVLSMPAGYRTGRRGARYEMWMSPYIALCIIRAFILPTWLGGEAQAFKPTGSLDSALNERDPQHRKGLARRMWAILINYWSIYHLLFVYSTLVAATIASYRCVSISETLHDKLICLLTHAFWPPLTFIFICSSLWTPISYAIDPPSVPAREQLLIRDPKTGVAHPTPSSKKIAFGGEDLWYEFDYTITTVFTCLVFVLSFLF
ncbi:nucleotide-diphospho-sugar transferase [Emericellopsis atlantica]|uniref:Nucleotide-diphospho-sugar transferase n=1 Tax=Emericellopsis atlantica TaxID=2614577 RepID=A0A9P7ZNX2_9HYPO|nr:nucleotide-diphospho-sugar transferase [Emericellopsis atlantica]KAG9255593.1 nucleotide-diphospho-sugar transferase [Emericellopsis atlantica]